MRQGTSTKRRRALFLGWAFGVIAGLTLFFGRGGALTTWDALDVLAVVLLILAFACAEIGRRSSEEP